MEQTELQKAVEVLRKHLVKDPDYRQGWKANIAMALFDEFKESGWDEGSEDIDIHATCNRGADRFLQNLCA